LVVLLGGWFGGEVLLGGVWFCVFQTSPSEEKGMQGLSGYILEMPFTKQWVGGSFRCGIRGNFEGKWSKRVVRIPRTGKHQWDAMEKSSKSSYSARSTGPSDSLPGAMKKSLVNGQRYEKNEALRASPAIPVQF